MTLESKNTLRKKFREIRSKITASYRHEAALSAAKHFIELALFKESDHIACYLPVKDEFDSSAVIEAIWQAKKRCYLPVLAKEEQKFLYFVRYEYGDALRPNRYTILEPVNVSRKISPEEIDITITPLIAFDAKGHRLGTGGGYYDRTFEFLHGQRLQKPHMLGLAYAALEANQLPFDPWDILLEGVITEKQFISRL